MFIPLVSSLFLTLNWVPSGEGTMRWSNRGKSIDVTDEFCIK